MQKLFSLFKQLEHSNPISLQKVYLNLAPKQHQSMGNSLACFSQTSPKDLKTHPWLSPLSALKKSRKLQVESQSSPSPDPEVVFDEAYIKKQAQIAAMLYHQHLQKNGGRDDLISHFERSVSAKNPLTSYNKSRRMSKRSSSLSCSTSVAALQIPTQDVVRRGEDGKHFVLVHGGGFGAWCWYKIIALLKEDKHCVDAIDLTGSGSNFCDINSINSLSQYATPLTDFLAKLGHNKQVILVGHDLGGACISHAMEMYPHKVSKAVFVAATMLTNGQSALDIFSQQLCSNNISRRAQKFLYAEGKNHQPTAIDFEKSLLENLFFNRAPSKDIALASVSMRPVPFAPLTEKLSLSESNYGSVSRFYIKTDDDFAIPSSRQESMIESSWPKQVFELKKSDHCPFFSRPQGLCRLIIEISKWGEGVEGYRGN